MNKTLLSIALATASSAAMAADVYNGRLTGMSGAGYVTGNYADGLLQNPSLGAAHGEDDDFALVLNAGAVASDKDELLDGLEDLVDYLDYLDSITNVQDLDESMADEVIARLENVNGKTAHLDAGASLVAAIPNDVLSVALVAKYRATASVTSMVDENDYTLIENSINQAFYPDNLNSSVLAKGATIRELGVTLSKRMTAGEGTELLVGITPKRMTVETFIYSPTVDDFDEDDFEADNYTRESSATNYDVGVTYISGKLHYGITVRDVMSKSFDTITSDLTGEKLMVKPLSTAAVGYKNGWITAEAALDLNAVPSFSVDGDVKMLRAGVELNALNWLQFRAGMQKDLEDTLEDTYSVGLGISPFDTVNIDVSAVKGQNDTMGAALQLGIRI